MIFNADKYKVLHFGHNNEQVHYVMDGDILESVEEERDLGVIIQWNLKVDKQCAKAAKTANSVSGMIRRSFINKGVDSRLIEFIFDSQQINFFDWLGDSR